MANPSTRRALTVDEVQKYVGSSGQCPDCGSDDVSGGRFEADLQSAWQPVECGGCGARWGDVYRLVDVDQYDGDGDGDIIGRHADPPEASGPVQQEEAESLRAGDHCPWCRGPDIEGRGYDHDGAEVRRKVVCRAPTCARRWREVFRLSRIEVIETGAGPP